LEQEGADVIEIGIPFTDPVADGPVIERASLRAMKNHITIDKVLELVNRVRQTSQVPLVFLMYANMIHYYGIHRFFRACKENGLDGVIVPDIPFEEKEEFDIHAKQEGIDLISLVAPTSKGRIEKIAKEARGFLYCVSSMGVTGVRQEIETNLGSMFEKINKYSTVPTALGFGISTPLQAKALKEFADGIIVGSAIVKIIEEHGEDAAEPLRSYVKEMVEAIR
jgi:tryptophan synthase alpha chain